MSVQLHTYVEKRLLAWKLYALWCSDALTGAPGPRKVRSSWYLWLRNVRTAARAIERHRDCPVDEIECGITQLCIEQLPVNLRDTVLLCWLATGTAEEKAAELGCGRATYFRWIDTAYNELLGLFNDYEAGVLRIDIDQVNADLEAERLRVPDGGTVSGKLKRPALHGISHAVRADLAPPSKKVAGGA